MAAAAHSTEAVPAQPVDRRTATSDGHFVIGCVGDVSKEGVGVPSSAAGGLIRVCGHGGRMLHAGRRWLSSKPASILDRVREALRLRQQGIVPNRPGAAPPNPAAEPATTPPAAPSKLREQLKNMSIAPAPARAQGPATVPPPSVHDDKVKRFMEKLAGRPAHTPRSHLPRPVPDRGDDERDQRKKRKKTLIEQRRRRMILTEGVSVQSNGACIHFSTSDVGVCRIS